MPDDHSKVVPLLPIPNRTVKRLSADDSADSRVKVGHHQALILSQAPHTTRYRGLLGCKHPEIELENFQTFSKMLAIMQGFADRSRASALGSWCRDH